MHTEVRHRKIWRLVSAGTLITALGAICLATVQGQDWDGGATFRRRPIRVTSRSSTDALKALDDETPPQAPEEAPPPEAPPVEQKPAFEDAGEKEKAPEEPAPEVWNLTNLFTNDAGYNSFKEAGVKFSGHMQWGIVSEPDGAFAGNGPNLNERQWGFFGLQQAYLFAERVADGSKDALGWGFRIDGLYGLQGFDGQSFGNINTRHWDFLNGFDHNPYNWAIPQAYGELAYGKWSIKLGHFYTIVGYEVVPSTAQFFITRQLTFWNSEPFTHTGALNSYKVNDKFTVMGGWVAGMDTGFYQFNGGSSFLGGFTWTIDEKTTLAYSMIGGNLGWRGDGAINSVILSRQWTPKFSTVHQFDVLDTNLTNLQPGINPGTFTFGNVPSNFNQQGGVPRDSTGLINYAFYDLAPKVKAGVRFEWYKADATDYYTLTGGINFKPHPNLLIRPEVRYMWSENHQIYTGAGGFSGNIYNQTLWGLDFIVLF